MEFKSEKQRKKVMAQLNVSNGDQVFVGSHNGAIETGDLIKEDKKEIIIREYEHNEEIKFQKPQFKITRVIKKKE